MQSIKRRLSMVLGLDPKSIGDSCIEGAVHERMEDCHLDDDHAYALFLENNEAEMDNLIESVIIPETCFFRNREPFDYLRQLISEPAFKDSRKPKKILSAPCASGEEPYSIAMTFLDAGWSAHSFQVTGLDISQQQLEIAKTGLYGEHSFRDTTDHYRTSFFESEPEDQYRINDDVRPCVSFLNENLLETRLSRATTRYDIIFCRNFMIYLHDDARQHVQQLLINILHDDGYLFLGHAEMLSFSSDLLTPVAFKGAFCYRKQKPGQGSLSSVPQKAVATPRPPPVSLPVEKKVPPPLKPDLETAKLLADQGNTVAAIAVCEALIQEDQHSAELYLLLGILYEQQKRVQDAESAFNRALYLDKDCHEAMVHLRMIKEARGDHAGALLLKNRSARTAEREGRISV